jgi:hypothetical protein
MNAIAYQLCGRVLTNLIQTIGQFRHYCYVFLCNTLIFHKIIIHPSLRKALQENNNRMAITHYMINNALLVDYNFSLFPLCLHLL